MFIELTVGVSCSGKTTYAEERVKKNGNIVNVNRDDLRMSLFGLTDYSKYKFTRNNELMVTEAQQSIARAALKQGKSVIVSDTNLNLTYHEAWKAMAKEFGATFVTQFFPCELKELLKRNEKRARRTPVNVIKQQLEAFEKNFPSKVNYWVPVPYVADETLPTAWIVDVDGTLAHMNGKRGPFDWEEVGVDDPDPVVIGLVNLLSKQGHEIIVMSGRDEVCYEETRQWLIDNDVPYDQIYMRPEGDNRPDTIIKDELFEEGVAGQYNVIGVLDDRNVVVDMWRKKGLKVLQVAEGDF